ncbi:MAG: hypothetical protein ABII90_11440, partial [Bacteroidota bacterium]
MKLFDGEEILFTSKNKRFILTTHRLRNEHKSFWGSVIKSILHEELTSCELRTIIPYRLLWKVILAPVIINGAVFIINNYLFKSSLLKFFFGEIHIESAVLINLFYISLVISGIYLVDFFLSVKKVISFHTAGMTIDILLRWLDFEERENFISKV